MLANSLSSKTRYKYEVVAELESIKLGYKDASKQDKVPNNAQSSSNSSDSAFVIVTHY